MEIGAEVTDDDYKEYGEKDGPQTPAVRPDAPSITRRGFVAGTLGAGVALAAGGAVALSGCAAQDDPSLTDLASQGVDDEDIVTLGVTPEQVVNVADLEEASYEDYLTLEASYELPLGSLFSQVDTSSVLVLMPGEQGESLRRIGLLDLNTGETVVLVNEPVGKGGNVVIYDARATRTALIWVETDLGDLSWRVYIALLSGIVAGTARSVEEGDADFDPPMLAIAGERAYWTVMPDANGAANLEDSLLRAFKLGRDRNFAQETPYTVLVSHGRMITNPLVTDGIVTFVPRVDTANVYYQLTALRCTDDKPVEFTVMPQSLRVTDALFLDGGFSFCIESNYDYAGGISTFGTYYRRADGTYLQIRKTPMGAPVRFGDCLIVKSIYNIVGVDLVNDKTFVIPAPTDSSDFGEALVGWGLQDKVVTCSLRLNETVEGSGVMLVRVFG
jgi:hypothetical protein